MATTFLKIKDNGHTTLYANITAVATTLTIPPAATSLFPATGNFKVDIYNGSDPDTATVSERLLVTNVSANTWTITRGQDGTTASAFLVGNAIQLNVIVQHIDDITTAVNTLEDDVDALTISAGETNTASNVGVGGVGVYKQKTGVNLEFKNINTGSSKVTVTSDAGNNEIDIDVVEANLALANISGTLGITKGGTGQITANAALNALLPTQTSNSGKYLKTNATTSSWASPFGDAKIFNIVDYGAIGDGSTDNQTAIAATITAAKLVGGIVYTPAGVFCHTGTFSLDYTSDSAATWFTTGNKVSFQGEGAMTSVWKYTGASATSSYQLTINTGAPTLTQTNPENFGYIRDMMFDGNTRIIRGLKLLNTARFSMKNVHFYKCDYGLFLDSTLASSFEQCYFYGCNYGTWIEKGTGGGQFSYGNALTFIGCLWNTNLITAYRTSGGSGQWHYGSIVERNGTTAGTDNAFQINNMGNEGEVALIMVGGYFEANKGNADIRIINDSNAGSVYKFDGINFNRTDSSNITTYNIQASGLVTGKVKVSDCAFQEYNTYSANVARPYYSISSPMYYEVTGITYGSSTTIPTSNQAWTSTITGFSGTPTQTIVYSLVGNRCFIEAYITGTSNASTFTFTLPFAVNTNSKQTRIPIAIQDNTATPLDVGMIQLTPNSATANVFRTISGLGFTGSGTKGLEFVAFSYEIQ